MKTARIFMVAASALLLCAACAKEKRNNQPESQVAIIEAYMADAQKTTLENGGTTVYWEPGDALSIFYDNANLHFNSLNKEKSDYAKFASTQSVIFAFIEDAPDLNLIGVYPYDENTTVDDGVVVATLPLVQQGRAGSFGRGANISMGKSNTPQMGFYNVNGGVRFSLVNSGIRRIKFQSNGNEAVAGKFSASFDGSRPHMDSVVDGSNTVTLNAPEGEYFETGKWYYIAMLPGTLAGGFTMAFEKDEVFDEKVVTKSVTVKPDTFGSLANIDQGLTFNKSLGHKQDWRVEGGTNASKMIDSDCSTNGSVMPGGSLIIDMQHAWTADRIILAQSYNTGGTAAKTIKVEAGNDKSSWTTVLPDTELVPNCFTQKYDFTSATTSRYIKITFTGITAMMPVLMAEIDLAGPEYVSGNCAGDYTMPSMVNICEPWVWDDSNPGMWERFYPMAGWTHENTNNISCDNGYQMSTQTWDAPPAFVLFTLPQEGWEEGHNVTNGKIFQTMYMVPGTYYFKINTGTCQSADGRSPYIKVYGCITEGNTLTDYSKLENNPASDPNYLASENLMPKTMQAVTINFTVKHAGPVSVGFTYETWSPVNVFTQYYIMSMDYNYVPLK